MPIQVRIPVQLRALTGGQEVVNASGNIGTSADRRYQPAIPGCERPYLRSRRKSQKVCEHLR